jgi:hypothetical protein
MPVAFKRPVPALTMIPMFPSDVERLFVSAVVLATHAAAVTARVVVTPLTAARKRRSLGAVSVG